MALLSTKLWQIKLSTNSSLLYITKITDINIDFSVINQIIFKILYLHAFNFIILISAFH